MEKQDNINEIQINGEVFIKKLETQVAKEVDGLKYCVIRTYSAGVHIGYVKSQLLKEVELVNCRRLYRWSNAMTLSDVAMNGCDSDKFGIITPYIKLTEAIEIIPCSEKSFNKLQSIPEWKS